MLTHLACTKKFMNIKENVNFNNFVGKHYSFLHDKNVDQCWYLYDIVVANLEWHVENNIEQ